jgi:outer membrane protein OmpA-like peptidoglycan-associated protein
VTPEAPQAAAPSNEKVFTVYFRFDRSNLTRDAQAVVKAAADYTRTGPVSKVLVTGYTDTSGSAAYNMKLSERRAKSTAKALAAAGVDKSKLSLAWKGKTELAVPTADGVKEPANRRSTIDVQF